MKNASAMKTFSENVRRLLDANEWTIQQLADECGIKRSNLSRILNGHENITLKRAAKIADALEVSLADLVSELAVV